MIESLFSCGISRVREGDMVSNDKEVLQSCLYPDTDFNRVSARSHQFTTRAEALQHNTNVLAQ